LNEEIVDGSKTIWREKLTFKFLFRKLSNKLSEEKTSCIINSVIIFLYHEGVTCSTYAVATSPTEKNLTSFFSGVALISETYVCVAHTQVYFF